MTDGAARTGDARAPEAAGDAELVGLLGLRASQIEVARREAEPPVAELAGIIAGLVANAVASAAVTALQPHDRPTHARDTLASLARLLGRPPHDGPGSHRDWLRRDGRSRYSMEQERVSFGRRVGGATPAQVLAALPRMRAAGAAGHVDLS